MATILEALQNANYNIDNVKKVGIMILPLVKAQLNNAVTLLEKGYDLSDDVEEIIEAHGSLEDVPEKE